MELETFDLKLAMPEPHDDPIVGSCGDLQRARHRNRVDDQRVVASSREGARNTTKHPRLPMVHLGRLAVHDPARPDDRRPEHLCYALVTQAYSQHRDYRAHGADDVHADTSVLRPPGPRGDEHAVGRKINNPSCINRIIAHHNRFGSQLAQVLHKVVGERVKVVHNEYSGDHGTDDTKRRATTVQRMIRGLRRGADPADASGGRPQSPEHAGKPRPGSGGRKGKSLTGRAVAKEATRQRSRYTPPIPRKQRKSPAWMGIMLLAFLILGVLTIMLNYLGALPGGASNWYLLTGLGLIFVGFGMATRYH